MNDRARRFDSMQRLQRLHARMLRTMRWMLFLLAVQLAFACWFAWRGYWPSMALNLGVYVFLAFRLKSHDDVRGTVWQHFLRIRAELLLDDGD